MNTPLTHEQQSQLSFAASAKYQGYSNRATDYIGKVTKNASYIDANFWPSIGFEKNALALTHQPYAKSKSQLVVYKVSQLISAQQLYLKLLQAVKQPKHEKQLDILFQQMTLHDAKVQNLSL
ncbi:hypothetical protein CKO50_16695 [Pseudoalteromonas sp. HM-SA03]|uniref:hypothetical protein n=1 Tax=Pseudoalteromonas sp. HM-SA03 TaxID=2029678 RepID=UPI000BAE500C|nr:hypothetical protein [Pseudoalteromonas sp. HM-SA03]PAY00180.1 hypothetical protein CKO50_16695 [Pseudoalteromonas sp. HM-SA03]